MNITIRVAGRQAQAELRAVAREVDQIQRMVGKSPQVGAPTSKWSPRIAAQMARQAERAQTQAVKAAEQERLKIARAAATSHERLMRQRGAHQAAMWKQQTMAAQRAAREQQRVRNAAQRQELADERAHQARMAKMGGLTPLGFARNIQASKLINAGKNINWVGRQLTYNFTLPLTLAGAALTKFVLDTERAFIQVSKVYGDIGESREVLDAELAALEKSFELLSTRFGVHQVEVLEIASAWAAAGAAGVGLAEGVRATLETMILGDMEAQAATEGLIAIQSQWRFSTQKNADGVSELTVQLAHLNAIENATGISTEGLIDVIQRAGGNARTSGAHLRELAALAAALVPATGGAAQAGTALRSIIASLMSPTENATEALSLMGITVTDPEWMGADVIDKLRMLADNFVGLSDAQQGVVSQFIATKWQVSRFDVLMRDIASGTGYFNKALEVTASETDSLAIRQRELLTVLESHPKQWDIMVNATRNALADAFLPMIPAIFSIVGLITDLAVAFSELSPETQKWILLGLALIAVLGPIMSLLGSTMQLFGVFGSGLKSVGLSVMWLIEKALIPLMRVLVMVSWAFIRTALSALASFVVAIGPIGWAIIAALAAIAAAILLILNTDIEEPIWDVIVSIGRAFAQLPRIVGEALLATAQIIGRFMTGIIEALSYLNPFARHSPSLVDNVKAGVSTILDEYKKLNRIPMLITSATSALEAFSTATDPAGRSFREIELQKKADVVSTNMPSAGPAANAMVQQILALESALPPLRQEIQAQSMVVARWTFQLDQADAALESAQARLESVEREFSRVGDALSEAQNRLADLANTPIHGLGAMEDAIFANQHAQNLLNLELLKFEQQGVTIDNMADRYAAMAGEIELLTGQQSELRSAGAGSDILSVYQEQIEAIESQRGELSAVETEINAIQKQLDALDLESRFLNLTKAINFDPLERQIDKIANSVTEMPFDEIVAQMREQRAIIDTLQPRYDELALAVEREKMAVEAASDARDAIASQLDVEQEKLQALEQAYSDIKQLISDMESALTGFADELQRAADEASRIQELFDAAAGFDFEDTGGTAALGREGGLAEIEEFNRLLQEELEKALAGMGDMDLMGKIEEIFGQLKEIDIFKPFRDAWEGFKNWLNGVIDFIKRNWKLFLLGLVTAVFGLGPALWTAFGYIIAQIAPKVWGWVNDYVIQPIWRALQTGWDFITGVWSFLWETLLQPVINFGITLFEIFLTPIRIVFGIVVTVIQTFWNVVSGIFQAVWEAIDGYVIPIFELFKTLFLIGFELMRRAIEFWWLIISNIFNIVEFAIRRGVVPAFEWLWRRGEDVVGFLGDAIDRIWKTVIEPIFNAIDWTIDNVVVPAFTWLWNEGERVFRLLGEGLGWVFDNVIAPVFDKFMWVFENVVAPAFRFLRDNIVKPIMEGIYNAIAFVWNAVAGVIETGVNFFISAFNLLARAVNAVAGFLRIDSRVSEMQEIHIARIGGGGINWPSQGGAGAGGALHMAQGGVVGPQGGTYKIPHAIVGEGSKIHPEYVIPTDPRYRDRALSLMQSLGSRLMASGGIVDGDAYADINAAAYNPPPEKNKGILERAFGFFADAGKTIANGAVRAAWLGPSQLARAAINIIPQGVFKQAAQGIFNIMDSWVTNIGKDWDMAAATQTGPIVDKGPGSWRALVDYLVANKIPHKVLSTYRPGATTRTTGNVSWHAMNRAVDLSGPEGMINFSASSARIAAALKQGFGGQLHELIWGGTHAYNVWNGAPHRYSQALMDEHRNHVHASLAAGGRFYVPNVPGGVNVRISEGRAGEQFQVLPVNDGGEGGTTIIINGDLSFPNITDPNDVDEFIENLKALT